MKEKAKLLIAALDLGSPTFNSVSPKYILYTNVSTPSIPRRRSITAICGTPSEEICHSSK